MSDKVFSVLGATNHFNSKRQQDDFYATDPVAVDLLLNLEKFNNKIWECACGEGHISKELIKAGYDVTSTDLIDRGYGVGGVDFLKESTTFDGDIITNPPYKHAQEFVEKALEVIPKGNKVAMFLKLQFLEGKSRRKMFEKYPPKTIYVSSSRINCAKNGNFCKGDQNSKSAMAYAWYIWEKGFVGEPSIRWFN